MLDLLYRLGVVFILGLTEGLTEFLPISSTGHLIIIHYLLKDNLYNINNVFTIVVQFGAAFAVVLIFWRRLYYMHIVCAINLFFKEHRKHNHLCFLHIFIGTLPGAVLGLFFFETIQSAFDLIHVVYGLIFGGMFLLIADCCNIFKKLKPCTLQIDNITYLQAFIIGCFQCLAFFPGFSRSGATIGGGLLVGLNRRVSLEFSFFLSIPIICGAVILTLYRCISCISMIDGFFLLVGCVTAFCISIVIVRTFLRIVQNVSFIPFIIYRLILASGIYWVLIA